MINLTKSIEDYLEAINTRKTNKMVRSVKIANVERFQTRRQPSDELIKRTRTHR